MHTKISLCCILGLLLEWTDHMSDHNFDENFMFCKNNSNIWSYIIKVHAGYCRCSLKALVGQGK